MRSGSRNEKGLEKVLMMALHQLTDSYRAIQWNAQTAFRTMVIAATIALVAVAGGVVGMYLGEIQVSLIMAASNLMCDAMTVIFWRQYRDASQRMRLCQQDLLSILFLMMAFEVAETIEDFQEQDGAKQTIITEILEQ